MSMRYFTLSAVCMLVFCMLLALSGTTDFPGTRDEIVSPPGSGFTAPGLNQTGNQEAMASVSPPLPEDSQPYAATGSREAAEGGVAPNRPLVLFGIALVAAWVLLSFRFLSSSKG